MLTKLRSLLDHHILAGKDSFVALYRQPIASGMTIAVIAITLSLPALWWVFTDNLNELTKNWKRGGHISLYLKMNISNSESMKLLEDIKKIQSVGEATLKTPEEGLKEMQEQEGLQDLVLNLPENPLPAVIDVSPAPTVTAPEQLQNVYEHVKNLPGIEDAKLDMQWVSRLFALLAVADHITKGLLLLLSLAVVFIVGNTLRLVIQKRHEEIQVLKLVGASDPYIMRPFLYTGIWYGLASALLAVAIVFVFMFSLGHVLNSLVEAYQMNLDVLGLSFKQILLLIFSAMTLGWLGAFFSVRRQLTLIEP